MSHYSVVAFLRPRRWPRPPMDTTSGTTVTARALSGCLVAVGDCGGLLARYATAIQVGLPPSATEGAIAFCVYRATPSAATSSATLTRAVVHTLDARNLGHKELGLPFRDLGPRAFLPRQIPWPARRHSWTQHHRNVVKQRLPACQLARLPRRRPPERHGIDPWLDAARAYERVSAPQNSIFSVTPPQVALDFGGGSNFQLLGTAVIPVPPKGTPLWKSPSSPRQVDR
jgi:hypothetical protein